MGSASLWNREICAASRAQRPPQRTGGGGDQRDCLTDVGGTFAMIGKRHKNSDFEFDSGSDRQLMQLWKC